MADADPKIIPFGKYKGRLIDEVLVDDPSYLQWLAGQDWFRAKFNVLHQVIINRGAEPEETPDHNALQVKFLDDDFCLRFMRHYYPELDQLAREYLQKTLIWQTRRTEEKLASRRNDAIDEQHWINRAEKWERGERSQLSYPGKSVAEFRTSLRAIEADIAKIEAVLMQQRNAQLGDISFHFKREF